MASADDYAAWIVKNQDKKGTPEFETVAQAYKAARTQARPKTPENPTSLGNLVGAALEPNAALLTGMVAQPAAGLAGLATMAGNAMGLTKQEPSDVVRSVGSSLTYHPQTTGGKNAMAAIGYIPEKLGELAHGAGEVAADTTGSPAVGAAVDTAANAALAALGAKGASTLSNVAGSASTGLMQSALKPPVKAVRSGDAARAIQTLLDEGINVSKGGAEKIGDKVSTINDQITEAIVNSQARIPKAPVANRLQDLTQQLEKQVNPAPDVKAVQTAFDEFVQHPLIPGADMPVQLAQQMKQGTYRQLREKYGQLGSAETEAQKALARGLKEEIAAAVPEVAPLNAAESELLNAKGLLDRRVAVSGNHNPMGITHLAPGKGNFVAGMLDRSDLVKSLLARMLNPGKGVALSDASATAATAPQTFSDDVQKRQAIIAALMGARS